MTVLLNDFETRLYIELQDERSSQDPWDVCLHYFFLNASNAEVQARQFALKCLNSTHVSVELAAIFCLVYDATLNVAGRGSAIARIILHIFEKLGFESLHTAVARGSATVRSAEFNHLAKIA